MSRQHRKLLRMLKEIGPELYSVLARVTLCEHAAEDLLQELFMKMSKQTEFDKFKNPEAYLRRAVINLAFDWRRRKNNEKRPAADADNQESPIKGPVQKLIDEEQKQMVLDAVGTLKWQYQQVIVMRYLEQRTYEEIAELIGKDVHYSRTVCRRGRIQLQHILSGKVSPSNRREGHHA